MDDLHLQRLQEEKDAAGPASFDGSEAAASFDSVATSKILRKIDFSLLPYLFVLYM